MIDVSPMNTPSRNRRPRRMPDAAKHNPDPSYLRGLVEQGGFSKRRTAQLLGLSWQGFRNYLRDESEPLYRVADYRVQFALECLADAKPKEKVSGGEP